MSFTISEISRVGSEALYGLYLDSAAARFLAAAKPMFLFKDIIFKRESLYVLINSILLSVEALSTSNNSPTLLESRMLLMQACKVARQL